MAAVPDFNDYLENTLGNTSATTRTALNNQGLTISFDDLVMISEPDVKDICNNMKKPGGVIENFAWQTAAVANCAGIPQFVPNPGVALGHLYEKRLRMLRYYCWHLIRIQRSPIVVADATIGRLTAVYRVKEAEDKDDEKLTPPQKLADLDKVRDVIEDLDNYLLRKKGCYKVPLAYLTRDVVALPTDPGEDPGFAQPTYYQEMIRRCPHTGSYANIDNFELWDVVRMVCHGGPGWS